MKRAEVFKLFIFMDKKTLLFLEMAESYQLTERVSDLLFLSKSDIFKKLNATNSQSIDPRQGQDVSFVFLQQVISETCACQSK